jgi:hypothetical protein
MRVDAVVLDGGLTKDYLLKKVIRNNLRITQRMLSRWRSFSTADN